MNKQDDTLLNMQAKLIPMLEWFHNFCEENNLRYYALGGTMLGTIRHQGFIPWDDDIDVGMPRRDYDKFIDLCKRNKNKKYIVESMNKKSKDFFYGYSKIYDTSTTLIEHSRHNVKRGIFIDLFPLDGAGSSKKEAIKALKPVYWRYQLVIAKTCAFNKNRAWYKNMVLLICRCIPKFILNNNKLLFEIDKLCRKYDYDESEYIANFLGNWGSKEIVKKEVMGTPRLYTFENISIYGAEKFDEYLTSLYGDWRRLPPKEKRVTHHDYVYLNMEQSYLEK